MIPVILPDGSKATAVCRPDGSARLEWRGNAAPVFSVQGLESGYLGAGASAARSATVVFVLTPDGRLLPPLKIDEKTLGEWLRRPVVPGERWVEPLHMKGTRLWLRVGFHSLAEVDGETGKLVKVWNPPAFNSQFFNQKGEMSYDRGVVSDAGFNYIAAGRIYHAGFDGMTKDLGPARLD